MKTKKEQNHRECLEGIWVHMVEARENLRENQEIEGGKECLEVESGQIIKRL